MSARWRVAVAIFVGVVLGFFLSVAAYQTGHWQAPALPHSQSDARTSTLAARASTRYGTLQAKTHLALVRTAPVVPLIQTLKLGSRDTAGFGHGAVWYLQRALVAARVRPARDKPTGRYGPITARQVAAFQHRHRLGVSGIYGAKTHHALARYYDLSARRALQAVAHTRAQLAKYARVTHGTSYAWVHRTSMAYSQSFTRAFLPLLPGFPRATDCSGYVTWIFKVAGLPDPSGFGYRIVGYTGTLAQHGARISANAAFHVGDLIFYGGGYPYGHVAIVVDAVRRLVSSHGSPGIKVVPFNYRPVSAARRYF